MRLFFDRFLALQSVKEKRGERAFISIVARRRIVVKTVEPNHEKIESVKNYGIE